MASMTMTRRSFMKTAALVGATAALGISASNDLVEANYAEAAESSEVKIMKTACRGCISNCAVLAHVQNGRVIKLEGNPDSPMSRGGMCAKGLSGIQALYNPNRNKYPMKLVGERGSNEWERISWDEAIETIAEKLNDFSAKYGPESIAVSTGGGGNPHFSNPKRFAEGIGTPNCWEPGCAQCYLPRMAAAQLSFGGKANKTSNLSLADSNCPDIYFTDTALTNVVFWGTDPCYDSPSTAGRTITELRSRKEGLKTVVIDPRMTMDAAKADVWLPIRPGTDVALMMAWIKYIIDNELYDATFIRQWTNAPYLVNPSTRYCLRGDEAGLGGTSSDFVIWNATTNSAEIVPYPVPDSLDVELFGTHTINGMECSTGYELLKEACDEYTLDKAAEICWLDADKIEEAIKIYTEKGVTSGLIHGVATDHSPQSQQAALAALTLEFLMGNIEKPGSILQRFPSGPCKDQLGDTPNLLSSDIVDKRLGYVEHKGLGSWNMAFIPDIEKAIIEGDPYQIHAWIDRSGNKHVVLGNASIIEEMVPKLDFILHIYMYPTAFTRFCADMVLPCTEWLETNLPINQANTVVMRQEVTHLFETVEEGIIWTQILQKMAALGNTQCAKAFDASLCGSAGVMYKNEDEKRKMHLNKLDMTWDEACEAGIITWTDEATYRHYNAHLDIDSTTGLAQGFGTPSKKCEVYCESNIRMGRTGWPFSSATGIANYGMKPASVDYEPLPYYVEPAESPLTDTEYPLVLTEGRLPMYHHGTLRNVPFIRELYPVPEMWINPIDAEKYGIVDGEWAWLESRRGKTRGQAKVTNGIAPGVVYQERFWNPELLDSDDPEQSWKAMNINLLTKTDAPYNPEYGTYTLRGFTIKVSPCPEGPPKGTWTTGTDFEPWMPEPSDPTEEVFE